MKYLSLLILTLILSPLTNEAGSPQSADTEVDSPTQSLAEIRRSFWATLWSNEDRSTEAEYLRTTAYERLLEQYRVLGLDVDEGPNTSIAVSWAIEGRPANSVIPLAILEAEHLHPDAHLFLLSINRGENPWFRPGTPKVAEYILQIATNGHPYALTEAIRIRIFNPRDSQDFAEAIDLTFDYENINEVMLLQGVGFFLTSRKSTALNELWTNYLAESIQPKDFREYLAYCSMVLMRQGRTDEAALLLEQAGTESPMPEALALSWSELILTHPTSTPSDSEREWAIRFCENILKTESNNSIRAAEILTWYELQNAHSADSSTALREFFSTAEPMLSPPLEYFQLAIDASDPFSETGESNPKHSSRSIE